MATLHYAELQCHLQLRVIYQKKNKFPQWQYKQYMGIYISLTRWGIFEWNSQKMVPKNQFDLHFHSDCLLKADE